MLAFGMIRDVGGKTDYINLTKMFPWDGDYCVRILESLVTKRLLTKIHRSGCLAEYSIDATHPRL